MYTLPRLEGAQTQRSFSEVTTTMCMIPDPVLVVLGGTLAIRLRRTGAHTDGAKISQARDGYGPAVHGIDNVATAQLEEWPG